jgi:hypothetical protein
MATTTQGEAAMNTTDKIYDASINRWVDAAIIREVTATEILHLASKMPYAADEDARNSYDYLSDRFGFWPFRNATAIEGPEVLMERSLMIRAAAENAAISQEVAA